MRASRATFFAYMGMVIHLLHIQEPRPNDAKNSLRVGFGAGAPAHIVADFERRFGVELLEVYGSTELGPASAPRPGDASWEQRADRWGPSCLGNEPDMRFESLCGPA